MPHNLETTTRLVTGVHLLIRTVGFTRHVVRRSWSLPLTLAILAIHGVVACGGPNDQSSISDLDRENHDRMVSELAMIADSLDPEANPWANEERLAYYSNLPVPGDPVARLQLQGVVAREFLNSGRSELAVNAFQRILDSVTEYPQLAPDGYAQTLKHFIGISYLRMGEQKNCLENHSGGACILPIDEMAVHKAREGSEGAIAAYTEILQSDPDNQEARWLLNIAYATLGRHPNGVPEPYRLSISELSGPATTFPKYRNIAHPAGLALVDLSGGGITEDFDGDNDLDVVVSSWGLRDSLRYFENTGDGRFRERTLEAGFAGLTGGLNLSHADYDNDGDFDILVLRGAWLKEVGRIPNSLLRNNGDGSFTDVTIQSGIYSRRPTQSGSWADYDGDGFVDLFVGNESNEVAVHPSELFRNNGDGTFTNVAAEVGVDVVAYVKAAAWIDFDNDGDADLYVSILGEPNRLFENRDGAFYDVSERAGIGLPIQSFPTWSFDYDNDGWQDLLTLSYEADLSDYAASQAGQQFQSDTPALYRNNGDGTFEEVSDAAGLNIPLKAMGSNYGDLDNDGWLDFYVGTGDPDLRTLVPNKMYRNTGAGFEDVTRPGGFGHLQKGHAVSFADLDNDGDQDVHAVMGGALSGDSFQNVLFENPTTGSSWITVSLRGTASNRSGAGARLKLTAHLDGGGSRVVHRVVSTGGSFGSSSYRQSVGLGAGINAVEIEVAWPSGKRQLLSPVAANNFYLLDEDEGLSELQVNKFSFTTH